MGTVADKLLYLAATKQAIAEAIEAKGGTVPDDATFRQYAALIAAIKADPKLQIKAATPTGSAFTVTPDSGYDGLSAVSVEGDSDLVPENIAKGVTIYGKTGTLEIGLTIPAEYETYRAEADAFYLLDYEHFLVAENEEYITVGFLNSDYTVTDYDEATTEFHSSGWYSYQYEKATDTWTSNDYTAVESPGGNFAKNIKYASRYIEYGGMTLFPVGLSGESEGGGGNGGVVICGSTAILSETPEIIYTDSVTAVNGSAAILSETPGIIYEVQEV